MCMRNKVVLLTICVLLSLYTTSTYGKWVWTNSSDTNTQLDEKTKELDFVKAANPYSGSWHNYKRIYAYVSAGNACPNGFQTYLNVTYTIGMQNDFDDLRFLHIDNETTLDYWIEQKEDGSYAWVWVGINESITDTNQTVCYMYYNNTGASEYSNMTNTWNWSEDWRKTNHLSDYTWDVTGNCYGYYQEMETDSTSYRCVMQNYINFWHIAPSGNSLTWTINHQPQSQYYGNGTEFKSSPNTNNGAGVHSVATDTDTYSNHIEYNGPWSGRNNFYENVSYKYFINASLASNNIYSAVFTNDWTTNEWDYNTGIFPLNTTIYNAWTYTEELPQLSGDIYYVDGVGLQMWGNDTTPSEIGMIIEWAALGLHATDPFPTVYFGPEETVENENKLEFISIDGGTNGTIIHSPNPTFNWTKIDNTVQYHLQIATDSAFTNLIVNLTNINEVNYPIEYSELVYVSFTLPNTNTLPAYDKYYCRVRAYT